jgi:hypothetical protein
MTTTKKTMRLASLAFATALALGAAPARADEWDIGPGTDNTTASTDNRLFHAIEQVHDLGAQGGVADVDHFGMETSIYSSYQVVVDGMTGNLDLEGADVTVVKVNGSLEATGVADGHDRITITAIPTNSDRPFIRVRGAACGTTCTAQDRYRIRLYDTTYTIPRFNNTGSQATVLVVLNASSFDCRAEYIFFDALGSQITSIQADLRGLGMDVRPLVADPALVGRAGSIRIAHTCGYGGLSGKAVSVEPSTGFTFDTQMVPLE